MREGEEAEEEGVGRGEEVVAEEESGEGVWSWVALLEVRRWRRRLGKDDREERALDILERRRFSWARAASGPDEPASGGSW